MNMEERLREAFEQEAEHLHAPHGTPETAIRRGRRRRASNLIGGAALVLTLVGGTAAGVQLLGNTDQPEEGNLASAIETDQTVDESTSQIATAGVVDFTWEKVILPKPDGANVWNIQVAANDTGLVAIGTGDVFSEQGDGGGESVLVWRSADGTEWTLASTASPFDGPVDTLLNTGDGFVAIVRSYDGSIESTSIHTSSDGIAWSGADIDLGSMDYNQYLWFTGAASGNGATVIAGVLQSEPDQPPVVFEEAGVALQQNNRDGSFTVTDLASGELITTVGNEAVYGGGPIVRGPDGAVIVALPDAPLEAGAENLAVEQDGIRVEIDYNEGIYVATDIATGSIVASGSLDEMYGVPRIVIVHPDTGETILDIDPDVFYRAQEDAWSTYGSDSYPETELIVLATTDGTSWDRINLTMGASEELGVGGVGFGPDGFLLSTFSYGPDRAEQSVWRSVDGHEWELFSTDDEPADGAIVSTGDAYYRLSYGNRAAIVRSTDGVTWERVHEPASRGTYYSSLAAGGLGVVAVGQDQDEYYGPPVVIAKDGRTLVVDSETGRITVTEDATGEILTSIELDVYAVEAPAQIIEDTENGTIAITDVDGTVVMEFTEDEAQAAAEETVRDYQPSIPRTAVAYSPDGEEWFTATTVGLEVAYAQSVAVGANSIVIIGEPGYYDTPDGIDLPIGGSDGEITTATTVVFGTGPYGTAPETYVWVGRPR